MKASEASPIPQILLLDDDEDDYVLLKSMLQGAFGDSVSLDWYQKDGVSTAMICSGIYTVTLVDYRLGVENGIKVIREAKAFCPDQVVFLFTGWTFPLGSDEIAQSGADGLLVKQELSIARLKETLGPYLQSASAPIH